MKIPSQLSFRLACGAAAAAAGLLSAPSAFAQTPPPSFYFDVQNDTAYSAPFGDPTFSVIDDLTFTDLQLNETFAGGSTQTILLGSLNTSTIDALTDPFTPSASLTSAVLTGRIGPGPAQSISIATIGGGTATQYVSSAFSADLFGPAQSGTALGQFALISDNNVVSTVNIIASPAAVPEASTTVSLGLLLALGLGGVAVSRRRAASAK